MLAGLVIAWGDLRADPHAPAAAARRRGDGHAYADDLAHAGAVHRRRRHRRLGDLDARHAREAGGRRPDHTIASSRAQATGDELDRDLSPGWIVGLTAVCMAIAGWLVYGFVEPTALGRSHARTRRSMAVPFIFIVGFVIAGVAGYMAGLIGASNSPVSGIGILGDRQLRIDPRVSWSHRRGDAARHSWRSRCSSRASSSPVRRSPTTTCRT